MEAEEVITKKIAEKEGVDPELAEAITKLAEKDDRFRKALGSLGILGEQLRTFPEPIQQQIGQPLAGLLFYGLSKDMLKDDDAEFLEKISKMKLAVELLKEDDGKKKIDDDNVYKMLYSELKEELKEYRKQYEEALKKLDELKDELEKKELEREKEELLEVIRKQEEYIKTLEDKIEQLEDVLRNPPKPVEEEKPKSPVEQIKEFKENIDALAEALELLGFKVSKGKEEPDIDEMVRRLQRYGYDIKPPQMSQQEWQKKIEEERERAKKEAYQEVGFMEKILNTVLGHVRPIAEKFIEEYSRAYAEVKKEEAKLKLLMLAQQVKQQQMQTQAVNTNNMNVNNVGKVMADDRGFGGEEEGMVGGEQEGVGSEQEGDGENVSPAGE